MFIDFINIHDNNMLNDTSKKEKKKLQTTIRRIREDAEKNVMEKNIVEVLNVNGKIMEKD